MHALRKQWTCLMDSIAGVETDFTDSGVCKFYLTGLCPHNLFENEAGFLTLNVRNNYQNMKNKFYLGICKKQHSEALQVKYMEARKTRRFGFEELSIQLVRAIIEEADKKVEKGQSRVDCVRLEDNANEGEGHSDLPDVEDLNHKIYQLFRMSNDLYRQNKLDLAKVKASEAAILQVERARLLFRNSEGVVTQKLRPCDVCGALLSAGDTDKRLEEHFTGRVHTGFQKCRDILRKHFDYLKSAPMPDNDLSQVLHVMNQKETMFKQLVISQGGQYDVSHAIETSEENQMRLQTLYQAQQEAPNPNILEINTSTADNNASVDNSNDSNTNTVENNNNIKTQPTPKDLQNLIPDFILLQMTQQHQQVERGVGRRSPSIVRDVAKKDYKKSRRGRDRYSHKHSKKTSSSHKRRRSSSSRSSNRAASVSTSRGRSRRVRSLTNSRGKSRSINSSSRTSSSSCRSVGRSSRRERSMSSCETTGGKQEGMRRSISVSRSSTSQKRSISSASVDSSVRGRNSRPVGNINGDKQKSGSSRRPDKNKNHSSICERLQLKNSTGREGGRRTTVVGKGIDPSERDSPGSSNSRSCSVTDVKRRKFGDERGVGSSNHHSHSHHSKHHHSSSRSHRKNGGRDGQHSKNKKCANDHADHYSDSVSDGDSHAFNKSKELSGNTSRSKHKSHKSKSRHSSSKKKDEKYSSSSRGSNHKVKVSRSRRH